MGGVLARVLFVNKRLIADPVMSTDDHVNLTRINILSKVHTGPIFSIMDHPHASSPASIQGKVPFIDIILYRKYIELHTISNPLTISYYGCL